jgi:hypothetical protein
MTVKSLVGYTGFVGSNIVLQTSFDYVYNSKNIRESYGTKPDILVYSGVRAEKFLANNDPRKDYSYIEEAICNIKKIEPKTLVLISTIDVYKNPINVNEDTLIDTHNLHPYGLNRYYLEKWVEENIDDHLIVRLPGLYGKNIKKNFIFDMITLIPSMLKVEKYHELSITDDFIKDFYQNQDNGFYKSKELTEEEKYALKAYFMKIGFSALNFTDSRASFQFYNLAYLWRHIQIALEQNIRKLNLSTEPVTAEELYRHVNNAEFINEIATNPPKYDYKTKYAGLFHGENGYIFDKKFVLGDIRDFMEAMWK